MLKQESVPDKERVFICPCSKSYFSYAALFTHIKQKHDGKAPGDIIKPISEKKRGRPRKQPSLNKTHSSDSPQPDEQRAGSPGASAVLNSNTKGNQPIFDLKCGRQSQFKVFKKDDSSIPTAQELPLQRNFQFGLLKDLSRYLEIRQLNSVPSSTISQIEASSYLLSNTETSNKTVQNFKKFIELCKKLLWEETYSQILLLLSMLLQHIFKSSEKVQFESNMLHEHIVSFFDYINQTAEWLDLSPYSIFSDLNTIKTLIVLFNYLGKVESSPQQQSESEESTSE